MTDFVRDSATQHYGDLRLRARETPRIFVVHTGESRREGKAEESVLQPSLDVAWKYPEHYVNRLASQSGRSTIFLGTSLERERCDFVSRLVS